MMAPPPPWYRFLIRARSDFPTLAPAPRPHSTRGNRELRSLPNLAPSAQNSFRIFVATLPALRHCSEARRAVAEYCGSVCGNRRRSLARAAAGERAGRGRPRGDFPRGSADQTGTAQNPGRAREDPSSPQTWPPTDRPRRTVPRQSSANSRSATAARSDSPINHHSETWLSQDVTAENWDLAAICCD